MSKRLNKLEWERLSKLMTKQTDKLTERVRIKSRLKINRVKRDLKKKSWMNIRRTKSSLFEI